MTHLSPAPVRPRLRRRAAVAVLVPALAGAGLASTAVAAPSATAVARPLAAVGTRAAATPDLNYAEALQKSIYFYEAQQAGKLPAWNRVAWRGDSALQDGKPEGVDLSGGWYDAGDHVKFGFPMAFTTTMLSWGLVQNQQGYGRTKQLKRMRNNLKWATDYLLKAHTKPHELWVQVGDGSVDHAYWGPPEMMELKGMARPAYKITDSCPGVDVAAETAAAMAAASMAFARSDKTYSATLLTHARQLYDFAQSTVGTDGKDNAYVNCVKAAQGFYTSTWEGGTAYPGATKVYWDELAWASVWLYRATKEKPFLTNAEAYYPKMGSEPEPGQGWGSPQVPAYTFGLGWNDKEYAVYALMAQVTGKQQYKDDVQRYLDYWTVGYKGAKGKILPGGLAFIFDWASLRMSANTAWVALTYADYLGPKSPLYARYHDFARTQIDYALGANPDGHSYMVGYGKNPPTHVHHRAASGQLLGYMDDMTGPNKHVIYGALAGGPDGSGDWEDSRTDYQRNEVAIDFNAGITVSLARLAKEYGGTPLAKFPPAEPKVDEIFVQGALQAGGTDGSNATLALTNLSMYPPRPLTSPTLRYYLTLDGSTTPAQITASTNTASGCTAGKPAQVAGKVYAIEVSCPGLVVAPGDTNTFRRTIQLTIRSAGTWDATNDWSAAGLPNATGGGPGTTTDHITVYAGGKLVWGKAPSA